MNSDAIDLCVPLWQRRFHPNSIVKLSLAVVLVCGYGCHRPPSREHISAIPLLHDGVFLTERVGMEEAVSATNVDISWKEPSDLNVQKQIDFIESAIRDKSYGVVLNPASTFASNTVIRRALASSIPVVIMRDFVPITPAPHLSFVLENDQVGASLISHRLTQVLHAKGEVLLLGLDTHLPGSLARADATEAALRRDAPGIHIVDRAIGPFSFGYLERTAARAITENPHLDAIVALNSRAGEGAAAAIRSAGVGKNIHLITFDQDIELFLLLRRGEVDSIVVQNMRGMGARAIANIVADRNGDTVPTVTFLEPKLVTQENIDEERTQQFIIMGREHK